MKHYIEAYEKENERTFDRIWIDGKEYKLDSCYAGGVTHIEGEAYLAFTCRCKGKPLTIYCEDHGNDNYSYFILKEQKSP